MNQRSLRHHKPQEAPAGSAPHKGTIIILPEHGIPEKPAELMWRDYLIMLLHIAAELEQSLMVQYLYAAYSLGGPHVAPHEDKVKKWRDIIIGIAKEEMGHLLTVQNVLCLLGGPISFEREDYPWDTPFYPFTFCLEPLTLKSLAKYVFAEMPREFAPNDPDLEIAKQAKKLIGVAEGHPVGEIYDLIISIISNETQIDDKEFNADTYGIQASFDEWGRSYRPAPFAPHAPVNNSPPNERGTSLIIERMATRSEAIAALRDVAGQGESPHQRAKSKTELSHFVRFATVFRELRDVQKKQPGWKPARNVPVNPVIADPTRTLPGSTCITAEPSRTWASLFNVRYRMLLSYLAHAFQLQRLNVGQPDDERAAIMSKVFGEMYNLKALAGILVRLPLTPHVRDAKHDGKRAGPTFQMPYTVVLPNSELDIWRQHRDLVSSSQELVAELLHPDKNNLEHAPPDGRKYLATLVDLDIQSVLFIDQMLVGLKPIRRGRK